MTPRRIIARRLVFLLLLPGCHTWQPVTLAPNNGYKYDGTFRIERRQQVADTAAVGGDGTFDMSVVLQGVRVEGDSLVGRVAGRSTRHAMAVANVRKAEERHLNGGGTIALFLAIGAGLVAAFIGLLATEYDF